MCPENGTGGIYTILLISIYGLSIKYIISNFKVKGQGHYSRSNFHEFTILCAIFIYSAPYMALSEFKGASSAGYGVGHNKPKYHRLCLNSAKENVLSS